MITHDQRLELSSEAQSLSQQRLYDPRLNSEFDSKIII
jgi:hypothetical protein